VREACELEKRFQIEALPCALLGINSDSMGQYIEYCSDFLLDMIGLEPIYKASNPFDFMQLISLDSNVNFFEQRNSDYSMGASTREFSTDADF
jgi:ribonucleoside-diphosphate reductase subunit M2